MNSDELDKKNVLKENQINNSNVPKVAPPIVKPPKLNPIVKQPTIQNNHENIKNTTDKVNVNNSLNISNSVQTINKPNNLNIVSENKTSITTNNENSTREENNLINPAIEKTVDEKLSEVNKSNNKEMVIDNSINNISTNLVEEKNESPSKTTVQESEVVQNEIYQSKISEIDSNKLTDETLKGSEFEITDALIEEKINKNIRNNKIAKMTILICSLIITLVVVVKFVPWDNLDKDEVEESIKLNAAFNPDNLIAIKEAGKYGYIDTNGKSVIAAKYLEAYDFFGEYAVVVNEEDSGLYKMIDHNGNEKLTANSKPNYYSDYGVWEIDERIYNDNLKAISDPEYKVKYIKNGYFTYVNNNKKESGIINAEGNILFSWSGNDINAVISNNAYDTSDIYAVVTAEDKDVIIFSLKEEKISYNKSSTNFSIESVNNNIFKIFDKVNNKNYWIYLKDGNILYEAFNAEFLDIYDYVNQILVVTEGGSNYYFDANSRRVSIDKPKKSEIILNKYGYNIFEKSKKYGISKDDEIIIKPTYEAIEFFNKNIFYNLKTNGDKLAIGKLNGKTEIIDLEKGKMIETFYTTDFSVREDSAFLVMNIYQNEDSKELKTYIIYNLLTKKTMNVNADSIIHFGTNYITISNQKGKSYYNLALKEIYKEPK